MEPWNGAESRSRRPLVAQDARRKDSSRLIQFASWFQLTLFWSTIIPKSLILND
jgi:hypothetical protein